MTEAVQAPELPDVHREASEIGEELEDLEVPDGAWSVHSKLDAGVFGREIRDPLPLLPGHGLADLYQSASSFERT